MNIKDACLKVLESGKAMHYNDITAEIKKLKLCPLLGSTPSNSVNAALGILKKAGKVVSIPPDRSGIYKIPTPNNNLGRTFPSVPDGDHKETILENPPYYDSSESAENSKGDKPDIKYIGLNIIFYGAPGTGKSRSARVITADGGTSRNLPEYIREDNYVKTLPKSNNVFRTTFHPATNYASFVGSYKPCMNGTDIVYEFRPQVFLKAYTYACSHLEEPVYLIIEEINRGQCAEIFGDLFQLLDRKDGVSEDPVEPDEDIKQYLAGKVPAEYAEQLQLPSNLFIIATMNTSDQSLFPMDSAFKRRWIWKYIKIDYANIHDTKLKVGKAEFDWPEVLEAINQYIREKKKATDKQMGEFFVKSDDKGVVGYEDFRDKVLFYLFNDAFKGNRGFKIGGIEYFEDLFEKEWADKAEGEIIKWFTEELKLTLDTEQNKPAEVSEFISTGDGTPETVDEDASKSE
jgi:hypothetical protein